MGNCQAADAAAVVIQHPASGRTELAYWSLPAGEVMAANPGHYVAAVITAPHTASEGGGAAPVKHLKLLRPDDTLLLGRVYRLVSFEEVLKEFATKRHVKLSRVMVKAKDEVAAPTKPAKPRRRRGSNGGGGADAGVVREESDRSLAKVPRSKRQQWRRGVRARPRRRRRRRLRPGVAAASRPGPRQAARPAVAAGPAEHRGRARL
uniref:DUF4228 domain-containing protein n=1 Tax=Aegilops tauschii subsp. strangulata TaxID=200361 RepID=A0A453IQU5_AEGTS